MSSFLQHLDYTDDICLCAHKIAVLSALVRSLQIVAASAGLTMNCSKTKTLSLTQNANGLVQEGAEQIEAVDKFTYLGSEIDASSGIDMDIESQIKKARSAFGILSAVWRNANLNTGLKLRLFK